MLLLYFSVLSARCYSCTLLCLVALSPRKCFPSSRRDTSTNHQHAQRPAWNFASSTVASRIISMHAHAPTAPGNVTEYFDCYILVHIKVQRKRQHVNGQHSPRSCVRACLATTGWSVADALMHQHHNRRPTNYNYNQQTKNQQHTKNNDHDSQLYRNRINVFFFFIKHTQKTF